MSTTNPQITTITLPVSQNQSVDFVKLLKKYLFHWPLFVIALALFIVAAFFYLKYAHPVYPINSTIEFKDDKSAASTNEKTGISTLDQISSPVIVENEIEVMQSKQIMFQVVNQLKLWVNYSQKDGLIVNDLYTSSPVSFDFVKTAGTIGPDGEKLEIILKNRNSFALVDEDKVQHVFKYGQPIKSGFGTWQLTATPALDGFIGSTIFISIQDPDAVSDNYLSGLKVSMENKDAPFVNLALADQVPQRGKDILNTLMAIYNKNAINEKNRKAQKTIEFIDKRLDSISKDLYSTEKMVEVYKSSQGLTDINSQSQTYVASQQATEKALNDIDIQIEIINGIENFINSPKNKGEQPSTTGLSDPGLNSLLDKLSDLQLKKDQMLATTPEKNPIFDPINRQIATLQGAIKDKITTIKSGLISSRNQLKSFNSGFQSSIRKVPGQEREFTGLKRNSDVKEKLYTYLLEEKEEISLNYAASVSDAQIVDDAHAGKVKWPKPAIVYVLAFILGLAAPAGLIYSRDSFDVRITNRKQIEDVVTIPILGELSYQESSTPIVISQGRGKFAIGEQFRVLRTNLYHVHNTNESGRVTLFTSSTGGEGKSFVSANLAVTLAYASRKTVILEMDLRKPKISVTFGLPTDHIGISNYLDGEKLKMEDIIQPSGIPGLDVIGCGSILPNPSELLERATLDELIVNLRQMYDDVIIDSPPIHLVTDALIISRVADASLYIMRQGYTQKAELDFINEIKSEKRFPKLNIIFNGIKRDKYGYGYNYDNSYYNSYTEKRKHTVGNMVKKFFSRF